MAVETTLATDDEGRLRQAARALVDTFGSRAELEYLPGKTVFRDALYERWSLSLLEAEELCDSLEQNGLIVYRGASAGDDESGGWLIMSHEERGALFP